MWPLLLCLSTLGPTQEDAEPALRVLSFNVRYGTARDGDNRWESRRDVVLQVLHEQRPDILGVQEALAFQMEELRTALPGYTVVGTGRDGGTKGEYAALFLRDQRLEVLDRGQFWLSETPDEVGSVGWDAALTRICSWAVIRDRHSQGRAALFNAHFDHRGANARTESAKLIAQRLGAYQQHAVIVLGDLNAGEASPPLHALRGAGLRDTLRLLHPDSDEVGTFNGFRGTTGGAKIDYVLVNEHVKVETAAIVRTHVDGRYPSDHFPVSSTVRLSAPHGGGAKGDDGSKDDGPR